MEDKSPKLFENLLFIGYGEVAIKISLRGYESLGCHLEARVWGKIKGGAYFFHEKLSFEIVFAFNSIFLKRNPRKMG